jgi:hypothetical protein
MPSDGDVAASWPHIELGQRFRGDSRQQTGGRFRFFLGLAGRIFV